MIQLANLDPNKLYSYADYFKWKFEERVELIKGKIFPMAAPSRDHQKLCLKIGGRLDSYLIGKSCEVYVAPFDVRLPANSKTDNKIFNVFQPDVCVICDITKLDARGCVGAPDIVVEIVSMGNSKKDMKIKFEAYLEAGVREYWIVSPYDRYVSINTLHDDKFIISPPLMEGDVLTTPILPGFAIDITELFKGIEMAEM